MAHVLNNPNPPHKPIEYTNVQAIHTSNELLQMTFTNKSRLLHSPHQSEAAIKEKTTVIASHLRYQCVSSALLSTWEKLKIIAVQELERLTCIHRTVYL